MDLKSIISGVVKRDECGHARVEIHKRIDNGESSVYEIFDDIEGVLEEGLQLSDSETEYHFIVCATAWYESDPHTNEVDFSYDFLEVQNASEIAVFLMDN